MKGECQAFAVTVNRSVQTNVNHWPNQRDSMTFKNSIPFKATEWNIYCVKFQISK